MGRLIASWILLSGLLFSTHASGAGDTGNPEFDAKNFTVYAFSQSNVDQEDAQVYQLKPDVVIRAIGKWSTMGDEASDYDFGQITRYHRDHVAFIGGGTASVIFRQEFASNAIFDDMSTRDANNIPVPHDYIVPGARRGSLFNPKFRKHVVDYCKLQIDGGVDGVFLDEVIAGFAGGEAFNWNGNEGFDDYALADFNRYLLEKYPGFTAKDWKNRFDMTDDNLIQRDIPAANLTRNFNYRTYLQAHGWDGKKHANGPLLAHNPLAIEWGIVTSNRMYADDRSFTGTYLRRYWREMINELREYARNKAKRHILITSNGLFPYVDFNSVGMYPYNPDEKTPDNRGADYVPTTGGHLNGKKSLMANYRYLKDMNRRIAGEVPLVVFIDWPTDMMNDYLALPLGEKKDYWQIFGAEAYASGIFPAFHLKDTVGSPTATDQGMMDFFVEYNRFYKNNRHLFRGSMDSGEKVSVSADNIAAGLMARNDAKVLHLINHNYDRGILSRKKFNVTVNMTSKPNRVTMISPDFTGEKPPNYQFKNGALTVNVDEIRYYDIIVIE